MTTDKWTEMEDDVVRLRASVHRLYAMRDEIQRELGTINNAVGAIHTKLYRAMREEMDAKAGEEAEAEA